ncbi:MAG: 5-formyltetrahydrofolate cyclo-ligase [Kiritimatiellia bacterium]|jgi:5-formyltetrahydrofolate cyclo-ligase
MVAPPGKPYFRKLARERQRLHAGDPWIDFAPIAEAIPGFREAAAVALYLSVGAEADTRPVVARCHALGKRVGVPAWIPERREYGLCDLPPGAALTAGPYGIPEPAEKAWTDIAAYDLFIVPGLLFDTTGTRLGHGKGFYDRLLAQRSPASAIAALAFDWQILEAPLPSESHDVPMDYIATPSRLVHQNS